MKYVRFEILDYYNTAKDIIYEKKMHVCKIRYDVLRQDKS
jgi:hypothetical protein